MSVLAGPAINALLLALAVAVAPAPIRPWRLPCGAFDLAGVLASANAWILAINLLPFRTRTFRSDGFGRLERAHDYLAIARELDPACWSLAVAERWLGEARAPSGSSDAARTLG